MTERKADLKFGVDGTAVKTGLDGIKRDVKGMADDVKRAGKEASDGIKTIGDQAPQVKEKIKGIGDQAPEMARKMEAATRSMQNSLQREIALLEAGSKSSREYREALIKMRGGDLATLKPLLDQLDAAKAKTEAAARAHKQLGDSAAVAGRDHDQLAKRINVLGSAADFARGQLLALASGLSLGAMVAWVKHINDGVDALNDIKDATGSSIENISALEDVGRRTGASFETVGSILVKFNDVLSKATPKSDIANALKAIGLEADALKKLDPAEALRVTAVALSNYADDANKARLIQDLFGKSVKEAAPFLADLAEKGSLTATVLTKQAEEADKFNKQLFQLEKNALDVARTLASKLIPVLNQVFEDVKTFGSKMDLAGLAVEVREADKALKALQSRKGGVFNFAGNLEEEIAKAEARFKRAKEAFNKADVGRPPATPAPPEPEQPKPSIKPPKTAAELAAEAAAAKQAADARKKALEDEAKLMAELSGLSGSFHKEWDILNKAFADGKLNTEQLQEAQKKLLEKQPFMQALRKQEAEDLKTATEAAKQRVDAYNKEVDGIDKWMESQAQLSAQTVRGIEDRIAAMDLEEDATTLATSQNISLAEALNRVRIARLLAKRDGPTGVYEGSEEYDRITAEIHLLDREANTLNRRDRNDRARDATSRAQQEMDRYIQDTGRGMGDAIETAITSGSQAGGKKMREVLQEALRKPFRVLLDGVMNQMVGGAMNMLFGGSGGIMGGAGGGGNPLGGLLSLGSSAYNAYSGLTSGTGVLGSIGSYFGLGAKTVSAGANINLLASGIPGAQAVGSGSLAAGGGLTTVGAGSWTAGGIAGLIAAVVINAFGGMRSESMIGSGLRGTLDGKRNLEPWEEWREGGGLVFGPEFTTGNPLQQLEDYRKKIADYYAQPAELQNSPQSVETWERIVREMEKNTAGLSEQVTRQSKAVNDGYNALRTNIVGMADSIGLAGSKVKDFAFVLDTQDLNFQGLKPEEIQAKIAKVMEKAGNTMAKELLGYFEPVTETITRQITENVGSSEGQDSMYVYRTETETETKMVYRASQYAKAGETVLETLTRLSTSFTTLNSTMDALGYGIQEGSLALADFASDFIEAFGGLEKFNTTTGAYMQAYYSDEERKQALLRSGARQANALGLSGVTAESLEQLGNAGMRAFIDGITAGGASAKQIADAMDLAVFLAPAFKSLDAAEEPARELADVVDELTQAFKNAVKSLTQERQSLLADLARANGDERGARSMERQAYLDGFVDDQGNKLDEARLAVIAAMYDGNMALKDEIDLRNEMLDLTRSNAQALQQQRAALSDSNKALFDQVQALKAQQAIAAELPAVLDMYRTPSQRQSAGYDKVAEDLRAEGFAGVTGKALERLSKNELAGLIASVYNLASTSDSTRLVLVRAAGALAGLKDEATDLAASRTDQAFARAEAAINKAMEASAKTIEQVKQVFDAAKSGARDLFQEVDAVAKFQGRQGRDFIAQALTQAQAGGALPDGEDFADAIAAVGKDITATQYASQAEADFDRLVVANELKALQEVSGDQLSTEEAQLQALKDQLQWGREQVDALRGIDSRVRDLPEAIAELILAYNLEEVTRKGGRPATLLGSGGASFDLTSGAGYTSSGVYFNAAAIKEAAVASGATGEQMYWAIKNAGFTLAEAEQMFGAAPGSLEKEAEKMGLRVFHTGTPYVPETQFALLQKGEAVIPTAYNPFAHGGALGGGAVVTALEAVRAELVEVRRQNDQLQRAATRTADAVNGRPEAPMLVENV